MSCVMPFERGTGGIADGMVKSLLEAKGIRVSGWKKGIMPDCEAKITPLKEYIQNYRGFFKNELKETFDHIG